jgi:hypothetical protein
MIVCISYEQRSEDKGNCSMSTFEYFDSHTPVFPWSLFKAGGQLLPIPSLLPVSQDFLLSHRGHSSCVRPHFRDLFLVFFHYTMTVFVSNSRSLKWLMNEKRSHRPIWTIGSLSRFMLCTCAAQPQQSCHSSCLQSFVLERSLTTARFS